MCDELFVIPDVRFVTPRFVCPKGHEQNFTFAPMAVAGETYKPVCIRCYMAWAAEMFPTVKVS